MSFKRIARLKKRAEIIQLIRSFFIESHYLEVDTPLLSPFLIPESNIEIFKTEYLPPQSEHHAEPVELYLIPSTELWMKRLLSQGAGNIFQITRSFRNHEPVSPLHQPEFTMLEWYTVEADYLDSISTLESLFSFLFERLGLDPVFQYQKSSIHCKPSFMRISMKKAFRSLLNLDLEELLSVRSITEAAENHNIRVTPQDNWADIFHKLFLNCVEPELPVDRALILYDYPYAIPTLARKKKGTPWAERWELYLGGVEIANCYTEEIDPQKIEHFIYQEGKKKKSAFAPHRLDTEISGIFKDNFPNCSGVALGVDRLLLFFLNQDSLDGVNFFPHSVIISGIL